MMFLQLKEIYLIILFIISLFLLYIVFVIALVLYVHKTNFKKRINESPYIKDNITYYKNLKYEQYSFVSNNIKINGRKYFYDSSQNKDIIIFSNGFNTTINKYISEINYLASLGYIVYTYDYAGVGMSEGAHFTGMPQAIINLEDCINYVINNNPNANIILFGHSMGAYASCNVLNIKQVKKVIAIAPFDNVQSVVHEHVTNKLGRKIFLFPIIYRLLLYIKFKSYSSFSTFKTLKYTNTNVLIIQGEDDKTVSQTNFLNNMYMNQNNFIKYILLENKHHFPLLSNEAMTYDLFLKHQITDLKLNYKNKIPEDEITSLNENINYELKYKLDEGVLKIINEYLSEV